MADRRLRVRRRIRAGGIGAVLAMAVGGVSALAQGGIELPAGPNRDLVYGKCRTCHDLQYLVDSKGISAAQWDGVLKDMRGYGLQIEDDQRTRVLDYLTTYLGPNPPPAATGAVAEQPLDPAQLYADQCSACHQPDGAGQPGSFPPLAGNPDLFRSRDFPVVVVLYGLTGAIEVKDNTYNGVMPSFRHLSDAAIAALVNHIRATWDNARQRPAGMAPVTAADVATARKTARTPAEVHAYRTKSAHAN